MTEGQKREGGRNDQDKGRGRDVRVARVERDGSEISEGGGGGGGGGGRRQSVVDWWSTPDSHAALGTWIHGMTRVCFGSTCGQCDECALVRVSCLYCRSNQCKIAPVDGLFSTL